MDKELLNDITEYCRLNDIKDVDKLINRMLKTGFDIERFGNSSTFVSYNDKAENSPERKTTEKKVENNKNDLYGEG